MLCRMIFDGHPGQSRRQRKPLNTLRMTRAGACTAASKPRAQAHTHQRRLLCTSDPGDASVSTTKRLLLGAVGGACILSVGCGARSALDWGGGVTSGPDKDARPDGCKPGEKRGCVLANGAFGAQSCMPDGRYAADCVAPPSPCELSGDGEADAAAPDQLRPLGTPVQVASAMYVEAALAWTGASYLLALNDQDHRLHFVRLSHPDLAPIDDFAFTAEERFDPQLAWTGESIGVAWQAGTTGFGGCFFRLFSEFGKPLTDEVSLGGSGNNFRLALVYHQSKRFFLARYDATIPGFADAVIARSGSVDAEAALQKDDTASLLALGPSLAIVGDDVAALWSHDDELLFARVDSSGAARGAANRINVTPFSNIPKGPTIVSNSEALAIAWATPQDIRIRIFGLDGAAAIDESVLATFQRAPLGPLRIAWDGRAFDLVWYDPIANALKLSRVGRDGHRIAADAEIAMNPAPDASIISLSDSELAVLFHGEGSLGSDPLVPGPWFMTRMARCNDRDH